VWVELLLALLVEGFREFQEWWQTRVPWRTRAAPSSQPASEDDVAVKAPARHRSSEVEDRVEAVLDRHARKHVGIAVGIRRRDATWTFARGRIGAGRPEPPRADTIFEIGSITKVFTATVLADMVQEGLVALEDPAQRYLPEGIELPVRGRPITLLDLATQTSGLPRLPKGLLWRSLRQRANPYAGFTTEQLEQAVREGRPRRAPGEKLRYSNFAFGLLGYLLALRAETSYERLVRERICEPLGLADTGISIPPEALPRFADGHNRRGRPVPHWELPALAGAGALRSTVADLLRFLALQLQEPTTRLGRAGRTTHEPRAHRGRIAHCLGWVGLPLRGHTHQVLWHNGGTGGFRSFVGFVKESETDVVVLSNCARSVDAIGFRILETIDQP
jgi:D-alanyl-D-alanine-carboxypeptidase/D-alanyl-D-alanine-endopeptidase